MELEKQPSKSGLRDARLFGLTYGMSLNSLQTKIKVLGLADNMTLKEAEDLIQRFRKAFPNVGNKKK